MIANLLLGPLGHMALLVLGVQILAAWMTKKYGRWVFERGQSFIATFAAILAGINLLLPIIPAVGKWQYLAILRMVLLVGEAVALVAAIVRSMIRNPWYALFPPLGVYASGVVFGSCLQTVSFGMESFIKWGLGIVLFAFSTNVEFDSGPFFERGYVTVAAGESMATGIVLPDGSVEVEIGGELRRLFSSGNGFYEYYGEDKRYLFEYNKLTGTIELFS